MAFNIINGPSKLELMLALFDAVPGVSGDYERRSSTKFEVDQDFVDPDGEFTSTLKVYIHGVRFPFNLPRYDSNNYVDDWQIEAFDSFHPNAKKFKIFFSTKTRKGKAKVV